MQKSILVLFAVLLFAACESSHEPDNDRDLIDEEKVQEEYREVKQELKEIDQELDSAGKKIEEGAEELEDEIDEEF